MRIQKMKQKTSYSENTWNELTKVKQILTKQCSLCHTQSEDEASESNIEDTKSKVNVLKIILTIHKCFKCSQLFLSFHSIWQLLKLQQNFKIWKQLPCEPQFAIIIVIYLCTRVIEKPIISYILILLSKITVK